MRFVPGLARTEILVTFAGSIEKDSHSVRESICSSEGSVALAFNLNKKATKASFWRYTFGETSHSTAEEQSNNLMGAEKDGSYLVSAAGVAKELKQISIDRKL